MQIKSFKENDILVMKKNHACKKDANKFKIIRVGSDVRMICCNCDHDVTIERIKLEKNIKSVIPSQIENGENQNV